ncbi:MAG TPA: flagellar brake protein [Lachnospiraceae bacterium]|nr:flagellar brake protein [Lachnospiraceae bacterium]
MLSNVIGPGCKIELQAINRPNESNETVNRTYLSQVYEIITEDRMEITMPMEQTKLILLPVDGEYDVIFYGEHLYQCFVRIIDRYKSNNVYILVVEMTSNLRKYQRRDYYRFSCALEMCARPLQEEEMKAVEQNDAYHLTPGLPLKRSIIVDISGGGLRFMSNQSYEPDSFIYCTYHLLIGGKNKECEIIGKILTVKEMEHKKGTFEHRVQYVNLDVDDREKIIKYIFEEERKNRRREKG